MPRFTLTTPAVLSRTEVFRDETLRTDVARQEAGWPAARLVVVDDEGRTPILWDTAPAAGFDVGDAGSWDRGGSAHLATRPTTGPTPTEGAVLLGECDEVAYWAVRGKPDVFAGDDPADWADLRMTGAVLDALGAGLFTTAVAVLNWHDAARFCPRDGSPTHVAAAGWHRHCAASGHEEYPRTDPAVICLVHDDGVGDGARVLLARQPSWPAGRSHTPSARRAHRRRCVRGPLDVCEPGLSPSRPVVHRSAGSPWRHDTRHASVGGMASLHLRSRLLATGWSSGEVQRLLRNGEFMPVRRGGYVAGPLPADAVARHRLAISAARAQLHSGGVVSHASAAVLHGFPLWAVPLALVHVTRATPTGGRRGRLVHVHTAPLCADEIVLAERVPATSVARTVVDLARTLPFEQAVVVLDAALARDLLDREQLAEALLRASGWRGSPAARRAAAFAESGAMSVGESRSRVAIARAGLPAPVLQWEVCDERGGRLGFTDFAWPASRLVGEFDGEIKYGRLLEPGRSAGDVVFAEKIREDRMRATELGMVRWTWHDLGPAFAPVAARIRARLGRA